MGATVITGRWSLDGGNQRDDPEGDGGTCGQHRENVNHQLFAVQRLQFIHNGVLYYCMRFIFASAFFEIFFAPNSHLEIAVDAIRFLHRLRPELMVAKFLHQDDAPLVSLLESEMRFRGSQ